MKYFDRKSLAIDQLFSLILTTSDGEQIQQIQEDDIDKHIKRILADRKYINYIQQASSILLSKEYDILDFIPETLIPFVKKLIKMPAEIISTKGLYNLLHWVYECRQNNLKNTALWLSEINMAFAALGWSELGYFKNFSPAIYPNYGKIFTDSTDREEIVYLSNDSMSWGQTLFEFPDAILESSDVILENPDAILESPDAVYKSPDAVPERKEKDIFPLEGQIWWMEVEIFDDTYSFNILLNSNMQSSLPFETLMKNEGWHEINIRCKRPCFQINMYDYAVKWREAGCQSTKIFLESSITLQEKVAALGTWGLNEKERTLYNLVQFYSCFAPILNSQINRANIIDRNRLSSFAGNRYGFEQVCTLIYNTGDTEFYHAIKEFIAAFENSSSGKAEAISRKIQAIIADRDKSSIGRILYNNLASEICAATSSYKVDPGWFHNFSLIRDTIKSAIEPYLFDIGFSGQFPHYRRLVKSRGEFISFLYETASNFNTYGLKSIIQPKFTITVGRAKIKTDTTGVLSFSGMNYEKTNSTDCLWERGKCLYSSIGPSDTEGWFVFDSNEYEESGDSIASSKLKSKIMPYMEVALCALKNKPFPKFYRNHQKEFHKKNKQAQKLAIILIIMSLFFGSAMFLAFEFLMPVLFPDPEPAKELSIGFKLLIYFGASALFGLTLGGYIMFKSRRKIWYS